MNVRVYNENRRIKGFVYINYNCSCTETVKGSALSLKSIYNIESSDSLSPGVFSIGDAISDNAF